MTKLTTKEKEALIWTTSEIMDRARQTPAESTDPIYILKAAGHKPNEYYKACERLEVGIFAGVLEGPFGALESLILKICIENTTWINQYRTGDATADDPVAINEALATLRSLAAKLEAFGIEIAHIPFD